MDMAYRRMGHSGSVVALSWRHVTLDFAIGTIVIMTAQLRHMRVDRVARRGTHEPISILLLLAQLFLHEHSSPKPGFGNKL